MSGKSLGNANAMKGKGSVSVKRNEKNADEKDAVKGPVRLFAILAIHATDAMTVAIDIAVHVHHPVVAIVADHAVTHPPHVILAYTRKITKENLAGYYYSSLSFLNIL